MILVFALLDTLERTSLLQLDQPYNQKLARKKVLLHIAIIALQFIAFAYAVVKGGDVAF